MGLDTHGKGYVSQPPAGFIGHAPLSEVCSNALICMRVHVSDVCVTVTSAQHDDEGRLVNSLVRRSATARPANCLLATI